MFSLITRDKKKEREEEGGNRYLELADMEDKNIPCIWRWHDNEWEPSGYIKM